MPNAKPSTEPRSPIKAIVPLSAGWSVRNEGLRVAFRLLIIACIAGTFGGYCFRAALGHAVPRLWLDAPILPVTIIGGIFFLWRFRKWREQFENLYNAGEAERYVAHRLNQLRVHGYVPVNDLPCEIPAPRAGRGKAKRFNIDHALIGPTGIYAIETKFRSKRDKEQIHYDGTAVRIGNRTPDCDPIIQARANADTLSDILFDRTGTRYEVQPVVLFPGWWIEATTPNAHAEVWVHNETYLEKRLADVKPNGRKLSDSDIRKIENALVRYQDEMWNKIVGE